MNKKYNLAHFILLAVLLFSFLSLTVDAQQKAVSTDVKTAQTTKATDNSLQNYINISSLAIAEQKKFFNTISAKERSDLWKVHFALFLVKHPDLSKEQRDVFLDTLSIFTPEIYKISPDSPNVKPETIQSLQNLIIRAMPLFSKPEVAELFVNLGGGTTEIALLQKYQNSLLSSLKDERASFVKISAREKSDIWRLHLSLNLVSRDKLITEQKNIILDFITFLSPAKYEISSESSNWENEVKNPVINFFQRMSSSFSKTEIVEIFFILGDSSQSCSAMTSPTPTTTQLASRPICLCSSFLSECDIFGSNCGGNICYQLPLGCGPGSIFPCDRIHCVLN